MPAPSGLRVMFTRGDFEFGEAWDSEEGGPTSSETLKVTSFALMERRDGTTYVDAVVQRDLEDTHMEDAIKKDAAHTLSGSHLHFASEYRPYGSTIQEPYRNWLLLPLERASGHMFPIPPGAVRGVWRKPAVTDADVGKRMTVVGGNSITVNGERRSVGWNGAAPTGAGINDKVIAAVDKFNNCKPRVMFEGVGDDMGYPMIEIPYLTGAANEKRIDLAFAQTKKQDGGRVETRFFMPIRSENIATGNCETSLLDARQVNFGELQFHHFVGACRN